MLAGEPPFQGSDARAVMAKQVTEAPRPLRGFRPEVPVATERAVVHALEKDPQQRYASAAEFVTALVTPAGPGATHTRPRPGPSPCSPLSTPVPTLRTST